jgi:hypothetical protein
VNSHFGDSHVEGPKTLHQDSRNREVQSPDRVRSFVVGPTLITSQNSDISPFRRIGGRDFCPEIPEIMRRDISTGEGHHQPFRRIDISGFRSWRVKTLRRRSHEVARSEVPKS